jgi:uncharacterized protein YyaL (SSP411 family)
MRGAPKFPQCALFEFLWRAGLRGTDDRFFALVEHTLDRICEGGIYDHLGGGFSRYSVDERWLVPHFEKMLYDNAQLLELLALAYVRSGKPLFLQRARETIGWLTREMTTAEGAFCSSLDADSEGEEGKFYVWSLEEITEVLGAENAAFFAAQYDVTAQGNFEGHNIINRLKGIARTPEDEARLSMLRSMLQQKREGRVRPGLDDKVLADWNGLMIAALANAGAMIGEPEWIGLAARAFDFIAKDMTRGDRLGHSWRDGKLLYPGLASDYAAMIKAALALHQASSEKKYLDQALTWQAAFDRHYTNDNNSGYYLTADDAEGLVVRPDSTADDAIPNPNGIAADNLVRLAAFTGDESFRVKADRLISGVLSEGAENLFGRISILNAADLRIGGAEVVIAGADDGSLTNAALKLPSLVRTVVRAPSTDALSPSHPAREKIHATGTRAAAFICVGQTCSLPVTSAAEIAKVFEDSHAAA